MADLIPFATIEDVEKLWRSFKSETEKERAEELLSVVSNQLRYEAIKVGKDLDKMVENEIIASVAKSVTVDVVARTLMTSTDSEPMSQFSESALGYSVSGTYLIPGGGLFIKKSELARLGLRRQRLGAVDYDTGNSSQVN